MKSGQPLVCLALCASLATCQGRAQQFSPQDATTLRAVFDSVTAEVRAGNWDAWANHFTADARFHPSNGPALVGRPAILAWGKASPPAHTFVFANVEVAGEGNLAYGSSNVVLQFGSYPADTAKQLVVFRRDQSGRWLVQAVSVTSDLPITQPAVPKRS